MQNANFAALRKTKFDLAVIDYSADGSDTLRYTPQQIHSLQNSPGKHKTVLAYMSIGEAEDYRFYWQTAWDPHHTGKPAAGAPTWLGPSNPDWPDNYKVKYWDPNWQAVVFQYVDKLVAAGYDGAYLDIIDAFEYWGPGGPSSLNRASAAADMVSFVKAIAHHARVVDQDPGFQIYVQNGESLGVDPDYLATINGLGVEDLWCNGNSRNNAAEVAARLADTDRFEYAGKTVLSIDYVTRKGLINDFYAKAKSRGYVPYASTRKLDRLTINPGHAPD